MRVGWMILGVDITKFVLAHFWNVCRVSFLMRKKTETSLRGSIEFAYLAAKQLAADPTLPQAISETIKVQILAPIERANQKILKTSEVKRVSNLKKKTGLTEESSAL